MKIPNDLKSTKFIIHKIFPPDDDLAVHLLRLMAGRNDLDFVHEWVMENVELPDTEAAKVLAASLWALQLRLLAAILHEILNVIEEMDRLPGFAAVQGGMDDAGRVALQQLLNVRNGSDAFSRKFLAVTRHRTAYHYDRNDFKSALRRILDHYGPEIKTQVVFRPLTGKQQVHVTLPELIRAEVSVGLTGEGGGSAELDCFLRLQEDFNRFLKNITVAYCESRGIDARDLGIEEWQ